MGTITETAVLNRDGDTRKAEGPERATLSSAGGVHKGGHPTKEAGEIVSYRDDVVSSVRCLGVSRLLQLPNQNPAVFKTKMVSRNLFIEIVFIIILEMFHLPKLTPE